ncbi:MAG: N-6 DNA methylase [Prevotella sp.]|nr:N-6 DNA methylase [Prevotella sp.]
MSKLQRLRDNIAALKNAFDFKGEYDPAILGKYSGFGGLGFVLNPLDTAAWAKSDLDCFVDTILLHQLLKDNSTDERDYRRMLDSLKASTLTAYYTPREVPEAIFEAIYGMKKNFYGKGIDPSAILDPAAGTGVFLKEAELTAAGGKRFKSTAYEKDILTGMILNATTSVLDTNVRIDGFETIPSSDLGRFGLVATNVPFGDIKVYDPEYSNSKEPVRREAAKMIHRYYVMKGLDCLHDGGIEAYIITSNYLNRDTEQLRYVLQNARLIGAYRLANNLFKEAGTEVGTDLLVLQKQQGRAEITPDESLLLTTYEDNGCPTNLYFTCYPERVIATGTKIDTDPYGKPGFVYDHRDGVKGVAKDLERVLSADLKSNVDVALFENGERGTSEQHTTQKETLTEKEEALVAIYKSYTKLYEYEATKLDEGTELRKMVNRLYDDFIMQYGHLNNTSNSRAVKKLKLTELLAIERKEEGRWVKADIMLRPIAFATDDLHEAETPQEALAASLNDYGKPDIRYMTALTGMSESELLAQLSGDVFFNPLNNEFEIKAKFVAGNVIEKLEQIKKLWPKVAERLDEETSDNGSRTPSTKEDGDEARVLQSMRALQSAIPTPIPFDELDFNLGERWIDVSVYESFGSEFFSMPGHDARVTVKYNNLLDQYAADVHRGNEKIWTQYRISSEASETIDGMGLFVHALHNTCPKMMKYKRDADGHLVFGINHDRIKEDDSEKTQLANVKIEEIRQGFVDWLQRQPKTFRDGLANIYNRRFNCFVKPKYDGSHQTFPGIDMEGLRKKYGIEHIYDSQKDCVWMLLLNGGGICDHEVGSGKTLIMCMAAHEMKRLGMCHKPIIIGLKANVSAIAETYRTAYPEAKILFARESDYSGANRASFFNNAKNNDYDCIIMSHDQFSRIPQSDVIQLEIMRDELSQLEDSMAAMRDWGWSLTRKMRRGMEIRKRNMEAKIRKLQDDIHKKADDVVDFNLLGIDHIFVDESHQFKNLGFSTRHDRVAGMGNTEGSKRAFNLLMAIRTIQKRTGRDLGATFLSGTTVTNSLTELYCLFKYLRPKALQQQYISCFDAWAAIFTKKSVEFEFSITNTIVQKERFRYFIKVPELAMFYNEITDFRTAEDVGIDRPEKHAMLLNIKPTPDQEEYIKRLMEFAKTGDFDLIGIDSPSQQQRMAKMLYATDLARKMSLDMRMIDASYEDHPRNKASQCASLIKKYYDKYDAQKGTQLVFSDLSTWQDNQSWSVYGEIKKKLVEEYGIPASEIRFIQECKCDSKKQALIKQVNEGKVRVLFGSTSMLGTGVNAQQRVVAVHHLDTPWRPSDLEQRDGRAIRRGNEIAKLYADNKVDVIIYAVERSLDSYKFNLLHCKQTFINQLKRGQLGIRTIDEGSMDENGGMNFSEYMAILSGNTDLLERAKLEKRIGGLESERKNYLREQREQEEKQDALRKENLWHEQNIKDAQTDLAKFNKERRLDSEGHVVNDLTIDGFTVPSVSGEGKPLTKEEQTKALGEKLLNIADVSRTCEAYIAIGRIYGFRVSVKTTESGLVNGLMQYCNQFFVEGSTRLHYSYNNGKLNRTSPRLSAENPLQALLNIPSLINQWQDKMADNLARIEQLNAFIGQPWPKEEELKKLRADLGILDRKIETELNATKASEGKSSSSSDGKAAAGTEVKVA